MRPGNAIANVLLVENQRDLAALVGAFLERELFSVDYAFDGVNALHLASVNSYDVLLLGLTLPGMDGLEVARALRGRGRNSTPILVITERASLDDKLMGFAAGADDYLVKPFDMPELVARLRALIRRDRRALSAEVLRVGDLTLDTGTFELSRSGRVLALMRRPFSLVQILMRHSPRAVSRAALETEVWGDARPNSGLLRTQIHHARCVIDSPFDRPLLHTVRCGGYRMADVASLKADQSLPAAVSTTVCVGRQAGCSG